MTAGAQDYVCILSVVSERLLSRPTWLVHDVNTECRAGWQELRWMIPRRTVDICSLATADRCRWQVLTLLRKGSPRPRAVGSEIEHCIVIVGGLVGLSDNKIGDTRLG